MFVYLLWKIAEIYVHIARGDNENVFPAAISKDGRSYNEKVFPMRSCLVWARMPCESTFPIHFP